jgi:hypothetical protein
MEQQELITRVDNRVDTLGKHGGTTGDNRSHKLGYRNQSIANQSSVNHFVGRRSHRALSLFSRDARRSERHRFDAYLRLEVGLHYKECHRTL